MGRHADVTLKKKKFVLCWERMRQLIEETIVAVLDGYRRECLSQETTATYSYLISEVSMPPIKLSSLLVIINPRLRSEEMCVQTRWSDGVDIFLTGCPQAIVLVWWKDRMRKILRSVILRRVGFRESANTDDNLHVAIWLLDFSLYD